MRFITGTLIKSTFFIWIAAEQFLPDVSACPIGFKSRGGTCCQTKICSPGEGYKFCNRTSEDVCFKCPKGTYNPDKINTAEIFEEFSVCALLDCSCNHDGAIIENKEACELGEQKICVCDRQNRFYGPDPVICDRMADPNVIAKIQHPGFELTSSGRVERCEEGYFKSSADLSICLPHTTCPAGHQVRSSGTTTSDVVCEEIVTEMTTLPTQKPFDIDRNQTFVPKKPEEEHSFSTLLIVSLVILVIVAVITICLFASKYSEKLGCVNRLVERFKAGCNLGTNSNIPSSTREETTVDFTIYESIEEGLGLLRDTHGERSSQSEIPPDAPLHVGPSNLSETPQQEDPSETTSDVSTYVQGDLINCNDIDGDTGTSLKTVASEDNRDLVDFLRDDKRPIGVVMPSLRMETQEGGNPGLIAVPTEEGETGQLVVTGQRMRNPISPIGTSNGDQHSGLPDDVVP